MDTSEKQVYAKPDLNEIGSFEEVTLAGAGMDHLDASFPAGTPFGQLTFS